MRAMHDSSSSWTDGCLPHGHGVKASRKQGNALVESKPSGAEGCQEEKSKPACQERITSDVAFQEQGGASSVVDHADIANAAVKVNAQSVVASKGEQGMR